MTSDKSTRLTDESTIIENNSFINENDSPSLRNDSLTTHTNQSPSSDALATQKQSIVIASDIVKTNESGSITFGSVKVSAETISLSMIQQSSTANSSKNQLKNEKKTRSSSKSINKGIMSLLLGNSIN